MGNLFGGWGGYRQPNHVAEFFIVSLPTSR